MRLELACVGHTGWVEVGSTRSSGGQDGGSASLEAGRGRARGRGRGRGRYDQDASGRGGPADRFAVRGPGNCSAGSQTFTSAIDRWPGSLGGYCLVLI